MIGSQTVILRITQTQLDSKLFSIFAILDNDVVSQVESKECMTP